jgi:hypothetical protein
MKIKVGKDDYQKEIEIKFPKDKYQIGVMLSGGADSAILLYLLCLERTLLEANYAIKCFTVPRPDGAWNYVQPIVEWVRNRLELDDRDEMWLGLPDPIQVGDPTVHHSKQGLTGEIQARKDFGIEHIFYGSQQPPARELIELPGIYPKRPDRVELPGTTCPFALCDKRHTLSLYEQFDVWPLIELTHSCTHQTEGRCGECYNCKEREWALEQLGFTDPGVK